MAPERGEATVRGIIGACHWAENWGLDLTAGQVVAELRSHLAGLRAICTSWDSGILDTGAFSLPGWEMRAGHAVSPVLDAALLESWPASPCGWDEWYFLRAVPPEPRIAAFCNYGGLSVGEAAELKGLPSGPDLQEQLVRYLPEVVIGDGQRVFVIAQEERIVSEFAEFCGRRRTKR